MNRDDRIRLAHGGGGTLSAELIRERILSRFRHPALAPLPDAATLPPPTGRLAFTTDAFVVSPLRFPGGNLGDLAVCGTVNDLAMAGAEPLWLSLSLILEEGLAFADLDAVLDAIRDRSEACGAPVVCGDTKVVGRGQADGLFATTAGIGRLLDGAPTGPAAIRPGDRLLVSGDLGRHGLAVLLARGSLGLTAPVESDVAPLHRTVAALLRAGIRPRALRDLTRGGLSAALDDWARACGACLAVRESSVPVLPPVRAACETLGLDPFEVACEGRFLAAVPAEQAEAALEILRADPVCPGASLVGEAEPAGAWPAVRITPIGTRRLLVPPRGEQLPRIC